MPAKTQNATKSFKLYPEQTAAKIKKHYFERTKPSAALSSNLHAQLGLHSVLGQTSRAYVQTAQNFSLRIINGCHVMTSEPRFHADCKILTVQQHIDLLSAQFLLQCHNPPHTCHRVTTPSADLRRQKNTILQIYRLHSPFDSYHLDGTRQPYKLHLKNCTQRTSAPPKIHGYS